MYFNKYLSYLKASYRSLCSKASQSKRDASLRLQYHMQLIHDISSAEEWIKERQDAVDKVQLTNQPIDRSETETRIAVLRKIGNEQQTGESLIHAAIGMSHPSDKF